MSLASGNTNFTPGPLASWDDSGGTLWVLEPWLGPIPAAVKVPFTNGAVTGGAIIAFKVAGESGHASLQPAWTSRDMASPLAPIVVNGVVFPASSGEFHPATATPIPNEQRVTGSVPVVVYALDGATGKE